jgi:hypothetical protein
MRTGGFDALEVYEPFELAVFAIVGFELDIVGLLERWLDVEVDFSSQKLSIVPRDVMAELWTSTKVFPRIIPGALEGGAWKGCSTSHAGGWDGIHVEASQPILMTDKVLSK